MHRGMAVLTLAFTGVLALLCSPVSAQYSQQRPGGQVDFGIFYDSLASQGDWVEMPDYGWTWAPRVERGWRPYTRGQWVNTDDGWYWDSDERFGWATYHYGRWVNDRNYGWVWVPGTEWAPAWVSWRHGNGYTGWAPLPPRATWQAHVGLNIGGLDIDAFIGERDYSFVQDRSFVDRGVYQRLAPPAQNITIINQTTNITNYTVVNQRVVNGGVAVVNIEKAAGRSVPRERTVDANRADAPRHARAGEVAVYRPEVRAVAPDRRPAQGKSLVKGEAPPPVLVQRSKEREQERRTRGDAPQVTAKDVQEKKPNVAAQPPAPRVDPRAQKQAEQQEAMRQRAQAQEKQKADAKAQADKRATDAQDARAKQQAQQQEAMRQRAQAQQDSKAQADKRATDAQQAKPQAPRPDAKAQQQEAQQQRAQQQADQRAKAQEQQKANAQAQQAQADKRAKDAQDARAQQQGAQQQRSQQQADERAKAQEQQKANAQAQADKRAKDAQDARAQQQGAQQQRSQQQADQRAKAQEQQKANAQAQADRRAKDAEQARAQQQGAQQQRSQQQADQRAKNQEQQKANAQAQADKRARDAQAAKDNSKDKGKKPKASPTPPPAGQPQ